MNALAHPREERRGIIDFLRDPKVVKGLEAVATKYLDADRMTRLCINAVRRTAKLGECNPQSVLGAIMTSTALGLEPNGVLGHAYLIPYEKRGKLANGQWGVVDVECQFIIGYKGYVGLAKRNPALIKMYASVIHANDLFEHMEGSESFLKFAPTLKERGDAIGAFCFTKERGEYGDIDAATVLPMGEIEKIRSCSETYNFLKKSVDNADNDFKRNKAQQKLDDTPWVKWFGEMAAKSAIRRHVKQLDLTHGLAAAVAIDESSDLGRIDMSAMADPDLAIAVARGEEEVPMIEHQPEEEMGTMAGPQDQREPEKAVTKTRTAKPKAQQRTETDPQGQQLAEPRQSDTPHDPDTGEVLEDQGASDSSTADDGDDDGGDDFSA